jgi:DNA-binding CsgD family transcriptional regulator
MGAAAVSWDNDSMRQVTNTYVVLTREVGALTFLPWALNAHAGALIFDGNLDTAASLLAEAEEILMVTGGNAPWAKAQLVGWRADGDAAVVIDQVASSARDAGHALGLRTALWARACLLNAMGQYEQALAAGLDAAQQHWDWGAQSCYPELIEAAVRCGEEAVAGRQLDRLAETVAPSGSAWANGVYARSHALLCTGSAAEDLYNEAIDQLAGTSIRPELARAHLLYGEWLRRENRRVDARTQLRTAHEMLTGMGIHQFADRARQELLATGETVRKRTVDSFDELTPQEANIARLAAEGRTNPEIGEQLFISPRTVEWHLRKVFPKLGVTSRRELREALPRMSQSTARE